MQTINNLIIVTVILLLLAGCTFLEPYKLQAYEETKEASDKLLNDSLIIACDGATHGAVKRRFPSAEDRQAFDEACAKALGRQDPGG